MLDGSKEPMLPGDVTVILARTHVTRPTKCAARGKIDQWRGDAACEKSKNTGSHRSDKSETIMSLNFLVFWVGAMSLKVSLPVTEDERASPLQNEGMDSERWKMPVKLRSRTVPGMRCTDLWRHLFCSLTSTSVCFRLCSGWMPIHCGLKHGGGQISGVTERGRGSRVPVLCSCFLHAHVCGHALRCGMHAITCPHRLASTAFEVSCGEAKP